MLSLTSRFAEMTAFKHVFWSIRGQITYLRTTTLTELRKTYIR